MYTNDWYHYTIFRVFDILAFFNHQKIYFEMYHILRTTIIFFHTLSIYDFVKPIFKTSPKTTHTQEQCGQFQIYHGSVYENVT